MCHVIFVLGWHDVDVDVDADVDYSDDMPLLLHRVVDYVDRLIDCERGE